MLSSLLEPTGAAATTESSRALSPSPNTRSPIALSPPSDALPSHPGHSDTASPHLRATSPWTFSPRLTLRITLSRPTLLLNPGHSPPRIPLLRSRTLSRCLCSPYAYLPLCCFSFLLYSYLLDMSLYLRIQSILRYHPSILVQTHTGKLLPTEIQTQFIRLPGIVCLTRAMLCEICTRSDLSNLCVWSRIEIRCHFTRTAWAGPARSSTPKPFRSVPSTRIHDAWLVSA
jgi:hypothetical protein